MTFTVEQKSQLAKLMATENITIEHKKIATAAFDPKNRVLYCPIWQDMSGSLYDLLMGHEVGHALYTPAEGWHEAASERGANYKGFLNVVEDARIEKKIRRKYPGLRNSFMKGYKSLIDRDFFDVKGRNLNELSFIDRVNIHTKLGTLVNIQFAEGEEQDLLKQVEACETWEDVVRVTKAVFDYSKNEQFEALQKMMEAHRASANGGEEFEESGESDGEELDDTEQTVGEKRKPTSGDEGREQESDGEESDGDLEEDGEDNQLNRYKDSQASHTDQTNFEPTCETDNSFRKNEGNLLDEKCKPYLYLKLPTPILENIITPAKMVHGFLSKYYGDDNEYYNEKITKAVNDFKNKNDRYIGLLAKEFEMKKAAKAYAKAKVSNTGDIDISRLYRYQVDDNIFRKTMRVPKGKSHGLVLLLDRSGSMCNNMAGSIEQILVLSAFCRKVNIPFVVYGFGNSVEGRMMDFGREEYNKKCFTENLNELGFDNVYLREYLNSKMSGKEYNQAIRNMIALKLSYETRYFGRPLNEDLSNTPLIESMVALEPLVKQFRKVNNLDLVNLIVVHDGDADNACRYNVELEGTDRLMSKRFSLHEENVIINHKNKQVKLTNIQHDYFSYDDGLRVAIFDWFAKETGSKIFGFFITGDKYRMRDSVTQRFINKDGESVYATVRKLFGAPNNRYINFSRTDYVKDLVAELRENKFIQSYNKGYESFFIMPGGSDLSIENDELVINGAVTANKLKNAFMKMNKKKQFSRVMVSRFIDGIAS